MNYLGLTGLLGMTGEPEGRPIQSAGQIADLGGGGLMAAVGVLAALRERERSGEGQLVDVSMTDGALAWLAMVAAAYLRDGRVPGRGDGQLNGGFLCYYPYEASDGWVTCGALEPKFWRAFCEGVGREDLIEAQFQPPGSDAWREVADVFRSRTRDEWRAFNDEHDAMIEPVLGLDEALASELVREREMVVELEQPGLGPVRLAGPADQALAHSRRRHAAGSGARRAHRGGAARGRLRRRRGRGAARQAGPSPGRARRSRRGGSWDERARHGAPEDLRAGRAVRGAGGDRSPLPARGASARAGQDLAQHGLLPAGVRRPDPAHQAAPGGAIHAAAGDSRPARARGRRARAAAGDDRARGPDPRARPGGRARADPGRGGSKPLRGPRGGPRSSRRARGAEPGPPRLLAVGRADRRGDQPLPRGRLRRADRLHGLRHAALQAGARAARRGGGRGAHPAPGRRRRPRPRGGADRGRLGPAQRPDRRAAHEAARRRARAPRGGPQGGRLERRP